MSQNDKELEQLMKVMLKNIKQAHKDLVKNLTEDQVKELDSVVTNKINEEKLKHNNPIMDDFFKTIYGK